MRRIEKRGEVNVLCDDYGCSPATKAEAEFFDEITRLRAEVDALKRTHDEAMKRSHEVTQEMARQFETEVESEKATSKILLDSYADENQRISDERDALKLRLAVLEAGAEAPTCPVCGSDCNERDELMKAEREVEALKLQRAAAELVHRETATTVLVQMAEVEALRADAERWRYINTRNNVWRRHNTAGEEHSALCVILPYGADLSCRATREIAIDAARAAQGCEHAPSL